jgi:hypothetical protein
MIEPTSFVYVFEISVRIQDRQSVAQLNGDLICGAQSQQK